MASDMRRVIERLAAYGAINRGKKSISTPGVQIVPVKKTEIEQHDPHRDWLRAVSSMTDEQIRSQVQGLRPTGESVQDVLGGLTYNTNRPERVNPYTADIAGAQSDFDKAQSAWLETVRKAASNPYVGKTDTARKWITASSAARDAATKGYNTLVPNRAFDDEEYGYWKVIDDYVKANGMDPNGHLGYYDVDKDFYREGIAKYANTPDKTMTTAVSRGEREDAAYNAIRAKEYAQRLAAEQDEWLKGVQAESDAAWAAMEEARKGLDKAEEQRRLAGAWDYLNTTTGSDPFGMMADKQRMGRAFGILPEVGDDIKNSQERLKAAVAREAQNAKPLTEYEQWLTDYYNNSTLLGIDEQMAANEARIAELTTGQTYGQEQGSAYLRDAQTYEALKQQVAEGMSMDAFTPEQRELWDAYESGNGLEWSNNRYALGNKDLMAATFENEVLAANRANIVQQRNYQAAASQPDFKAKSVRDTAQTDELYNFINDRGGKGERANEILGIATTLVDEGKWLDKGYGFLKPEEIQYYNYKVATEGLEAGQKVLDELAPELALRRAQDVAEDAKQFAEDYGGWSTLATYTSNLASGITAPLRAIDAIVNPDHSYLSSMYDNQVFTDKVREVRGAEWGKATDNWQISLGDWKLEFGPELGQWLYGLQTSGGDMLTAMAVGKGVQLAGGSAAAMKNTVQAIMSSEAGGATMYRAMEQGVDPRKAVVLGLGSAAIEALTEKYSIEELLKKPDLIRTYLGQNMLTEATEEGASNLLNLAWDTMVLGNQGDIMTAYYAALEANGGNEQKAARTVLLDKLAELGLDVLGGAVMGGGMASLPAASTAVKRGKVGKTINTNGTYNQLRDIAAAMDKDTEAYKIASETTKDGKISNAQAGRLYSALMESLDERSAATIKEAQVREVTQRLRDLGESGNIGAAADAIQQLWMGRRLTGEQRRAIATTQYGQQVINELLGVDDAWAKGAIERVGQVRREGDMATMRARHLASKSFRAAENADASKLVAKDASTTYQNAAEETEYNAKATVDGEQGEITGIKDVVDGAPVFTVQLGDQVQEVALADLRVDSYNMAAVADAMRGMTAQAANEMLDFYKASGINGAAFARGWKTAYNAGRTALGMEYVNTNGAASVLPQSAKETAYRAGEQQYQGEKPAARETAPKAPRGKGKVTFEQGIDLRTSKLTRGQRSAIGVTRMLAQVTGINFRFYQSTADKEGRYTGANGYYDPKTNTIALDLNAGKNSATDNAQFAILRTASHELTHYIAQNSQDMYRRLQTFVLDNLIKRGKSMDLLIADQIARAKENGITLSEAEAIEEVVADACEMMLRDSKAIETLAEKDHGLFVHIRNWLRKFYGQLKQAFDGLGASRAEALGLQDKDADGIMRYIDGLQELWDQAFVDAVENGGSIPVSGKKFQARGLNYEQTLYADDENDGALTRFEFANLRERITLAARAKKAQILTEWVSIGNGPTKIVFLRRDAEGDYWLKGVYKIVDKLYDGRISDLIDKFEEAVYGRFTEEEFDRLIGSFGRNDGTPFFLRYDDGNWRDPRDVARRRTGEYGYSYARMYSEEVYRKANAGRSKKVQKVKLSPRSKSTDAITQKEAEFHSTWEAYRAKQAELRVAEEAARKAGEAPEYIDAAMALINYSGSKFSEEGRAERRRLKKNLQDVVEKLGINQLSAQKDALAEEVKSLAGDMERVEAELAAMRESDAIAKSGLSEAEYFRKQAVKEFGYTPQFLDAGYLLPNGKMLNFSGEKGKHFGARGQDHRAIGVVYEATTGTQAMTRFMRDGNIRIMAESPGIDLFNAIEPTAEQYAVIRKMVREYAGKRFFNVDISDENGRSTGNLSYTGNVNADRVVNDIKHYFATGEIREQSSLEAFRFQARDYSALSEREILAGADPNAVKNAGQRQYLTEYQKSVRHLINLNDRLTKYQQEYIDAGDRNAQIEAKNRIDVVTGQIQRQEEKLAKMEARPDFQPALQLARQTLDDYLAKTDAGQIAKDIESTQDEYRKTLLTKASAAKERLERTKERMRDTQSRSALRDRIKRKVHDLNKLLTRESDSKHVPQELKAAAAEFLKAFTNDTSVFAKGALDDLRYAYDKIREENVDEVGAISQLYDRDIAVIMDTLRPTIDGKRLSELTQQETQDVLDMVEYFSHIIKSANSIFFEGRSASISALGKESIDRAESEKRFKGADNPVVNLLRSGMMTPAYFFKKLGGAMKKLYDDLKAGEMRWARLEQDARRFFVQTAEKYHYWDWSNVKNDVLTMQTQEGHDITLTREQALGLYATWRRENSDNGQQAGHLSQGGFVYENAMEQNKKTKEITVDTSKPNRMSDVDMAKVSNWLTDEQRAYADEMVRYMSEDMAALGNEVSMTLFGIKKYGEKYYFPYQSSQNYIYTPLGSGAATNDQRLKHSSFTNRTVQFANNPIIASDFTTVWANHVNHMILYGSMCVPLENFNRVYNYKYKEIDEETGEVIGPAKSVKAALEGAYGKQALKYIETLMGDLNGGMRTQTDGVAGWLTSKFKKNAVFASMSVVAQQPSAIVRAMALVDPKYFAPGIAQRGSWDELMKYSGTAIIKDMGGFDTATGRTTRDWLLRKDPKGLKEKGKELVNVKDGSYRDEVLSYLPAKADQIAWTHLWRAVKAETAANNPGLTGDAFLEEAARRFDEVVSYTQVYDSVLAKSQIMRSKDGASKMVTAFMAEPTVAYNLLYDAFANRGKKDSVAPVRAVTAYVATAVVNALLKSIVTAARDDEDKSYGEKYLGELVENVVNDVNPVNLVPYARDVWSIFQGYDVERADMSIISDLKGSLDKIMDEDATPDVIIKEIATTAGAFLGLPVKNVWRDVAAVGNVFNSSSIPFSPEGARYAMLEALPFYDGRTSAYYGRLLDAYIDGNTSEQESLNLYLTTTLGKSDKTVKTQTKTELGKRYKAGQVTDEAAIDLLVDYFGMEDDDAYWQLKEWREKAAHAGDEDYSFTRYTALNEALAAGNVTAIKAAQKELRDNGYSEKDVASSTRTGIKKLYMEGKITFQETQRLLKAHGGNEWTSEMDANDWYWLEKEYEFAKANQGDTTAKWSKYSRLKTAMESNKDVRGAIKELLDHGVQKGDISGQISDMYKESYVNLYKTDKRKALALQEKLLDWYVAAGYKREECIKHIKKYWLK